MIKELFKTFFLIFISEMGDKSQIIAMTFATRYKISQVLLGVSIGVFLNHGLAIILGNYLSKMVPMDVIQSIAGCMFIIFGFLALRREEIEVRGRKTSFGPITTVAIVFFLGEFGDKTQLTAMALSAEGREPMITLLGTISGMIATSGLGILAGSKIGEKIPDISAKIISSILFILVGTLKLYHWLPINVLELNHIKFYFVVIMIIHFILTRRLILEREKDTYSPIKKVADHLYIKSNIIERKVEDICLGEGRCGRCVGNECIIGYTKRILQEAKEREVYFIDEYTDFSNSNFKDFDENKVIEALSLILADYVENGIIEDNKFVLNRIKGFFELILFGQNIRFDGDISKYLRAGKRVNYNIGKKLEYRIKDKLNLYAN